MYDYRNPFADNNTNLFTSEQIANLFTEPFQLFNISKSIITDEKSSIIFEGGRSTGKTMLLRQFSYNVQKLNLEHKTFLDKVKSDRYIGIYFRIDNPLLRSFDDLSEINNNNILPNMIFTQYFELAIYKEYLEIMKLFLIDKELKYNDKEYQSVIDELSSLTPNYKKTLKNDIDTILNYIINEKNYISEFQSLKAIDIDNTVNFLPKCGVIMQGQLTNGFCKCSFLNKLGLNDINILLLIDEFESFSASQQKILNTAMRFSKEEGVRFRIGMRPYGFKTHDTLTPEDFVKEGRDYKRVEIGNPLISKGNDTLYSDLIKKISAKRLATIPLFSKKCIVDFLGKNEDLETEAKEIVKDSITHFNIYLNEINKIREQFEPQKQKLNIKTLLQLKNDNPLYEMENLLLLLRGWEIEDVIKAFKDYKNNIKNEKSKKYANDYNTKYKLSFVFILCAIYKKEKKGYYSFTDYCSLSSGIIGHFLELCRRAFDIAQFRERDALLSGKISSKCQTDAAYEFAYTEREQIKRISKYGRKLHTFIDNIGNAFSVIHKDYYIRYPETNQFPVKEINEEYEEMLEKACMWSLVIKKQNTQVTKENNIKRNIYVLNRVLAPVYKISYRTRGGLNPIAITNEYFEDNFNPNKILPSTSLRHKYKENNQLLFPELQENITKILSESEEINNKV